VARVSKPELLGEPSSYAGKVAVPMNKIDLEPGGSIMYKFRKIDASGLEQSLSELKSPRGNFILFVIASYRLILVNAEGLTSK